MRQASFGHTQECKVSRMVMMHPNCFSKAKHAYDSAGFAQIFKPISTYGFPNSISEVELNFKRILICLKRNMSE